MPMLLSFSASTLTAGPANTVERIVTPLFNVFVSDPLMFAAAEAVFVKLKVDPFSIVAELPEPGGSRNTKSGNWGPAVTKV